VHDQARTHAETRWDEIVPLYNVLERLTGNPMVTLNRAVAVAELHGAAAGLAVVEDLDERLGDHHRLHAVRGHLLEKNGDVAGAVAELRAAAAGTNNLRERYHLTARAARLASS
jgi:predicted RNA polymerase sigma factor